MKQEHKSELGKICYRLPSVPEALQLWGLMGVRQKDLLDKDASIHNEFTMLSKIIANMGYLIESVDYKIDGREVKTYDDLTCEYSAMADLCAVAGNIMQAMNGGSSSKKKPSVTP